MPRPPFLLLHEREIRACARLDEKSLAAIEAAFTRLARGDAQVPPPMAIEVPERQGDVHIKSAYVRGLSGFAVKLASGFYANLAEGLPAASGLMVLLGADTGFPLALLLDNGYLTDLRTGLAGAVAAKYLAPTTVDTVGIVGTGAQARFQLRALRLVRSFPRALVYGRRPEAVDAYRAEMSAELGIEVTRAASVSELVRESAVVVTTTPAQEPLLRAEELHERLHITAVGSDGTGKQELDPRVLARADRLVCDLKSQCFRLGELQHGLRAGLFNEHSPVLELGELTSGKASGRTSENQITVCDLTGVGVQDTAIAWLAYQEACARGLGTSIPAEEPPQAATGAAR